MIISVINNKGGVGKTTISTNLAHALALRGLKVLVVDQDTQANTSGILIPPGGTTLYHVYSGETPITRCIHPTGYDGVDCIPNENATAALEIDLYSDIRASYYLLRDNLREYAEQHYDITLIDNPPNLGIFTLMSLLASDSAIIPIESGSRYSIDGFLAAYEAIQAASTRVNHGLKFLRAVINKVDMRVSINKSSVEYMRRKFQGQIFDTTIPVNSDIQKAEMDRLTVLRYSGACTGSKRFKLLAAELVEIIEAEKAKVNAA